MQLIGKNLILKREGQTIILPTYEPRIFDAPVGTPARRWFMARIETYDDRHRILELTISSDIISSSRQFEISIQVNSDLLSKVPIEKIVFLNGFRLPTLQEMRLDDDGDDDVNWKDDTLDYQRKRQQELQEGLSEDNTEATRPPESGMVKLELTIKDLTFSEGTIGFTKYIRDVAKMVSFTIPHQASKAEFESIKKYFPKALGVKRFEVVVKFEIMQDQLRDVRFEAPILMSINESLFNKIENELVARKFKERAQDETFTIDQLANDISGISKTHELTDPDKLLAHLISKEKTKHHYHLGYLAKRQLANVMKLTLTGKPLSFIFIIACRAGFALVWETYQTEEATYLWTLQSPDPNLAKKEIDEVLQKIKWLKQGNKTSFLITNPANFNRIEHDYSGADLGFKVWQNQLELLVEPV